MHCIITQNKHDTYIIYLQNIINLFYNIIHQNPYQHQRRGVSYTILMSTLLDIFIICFVYI